MALRDDLTAYIAQHGRPKLAVAEKHNVAIIGETHAFLGSDVSAIRAAATVRLLLELLGNPRYRYFGNESFLNAGPVRRGVQDYWRRATLPPPFDPTLTNLDIQEIGRRVLTRRFQPVLDFLRANPRYILSIGSRVEGRARDRRLAQHFFEEMADRKLHPAIPGVLLVGANHAAAKPVVNEATTRMILQQRGYKCLSIRVLTDFMREGDADDAVVPVVEGPVTSPAQVTDIRLTSLVAQSPWTVPTDRPSPTHQPSPFRRVAFPNHDTSVAEQFEYIVLQKA